MKLKLLLTIVFSQIVIILFAQKKVKKMDCKVLNQILNLKDFEQQFFICKNNFDTLIIIDTTYSISNCKPINSCIKEIVIDRTNNYHPNKNTGKEPKNLIVLFKLIKRKKYYVLDLWRPYNNATLTIKATPTKNQFIIKVIGKGVF